MCCLFGALLGRWSNYWPNSVGEHIMNKTFIAKLNCISWMFMHFTYIINARNIEHIETLLVQS
jgi:hypothetical protein